MKIDCEIASVQLKVTKLVKTLRFLWHIHCFRVCEMKGNILIIFVNK